MARTFKHSGDLGDIIFALPAVRALGGGILYLDPQGGATEPLVLTSGTPKTKLNAGSIESLKTLLARVPYVNEVRSWNGEAVDVNLDVFRQHARFNNLSDAYLSAFGLPFTERDRQWLEISDPLSDSRFPIIIARSVRYHGNYVFWALNTPKIAHQCAFVGLPKDHEIFEYTFEIKVHYWPTPDILTLARVIAGAQQFIGNQGLPHALAEAMKKNLINEVFRPNPAAVFKRPGAAYV
jgi:hypothetical protein